MEAVVVGSTFEKGGRTYRISFTQTYLDEFSSQVRTKLKLEVLAKCQPKDPKLPTVWEKVKGDLFADDLFRMAASGEVKLHIVQNAWPLCWHPDPYGNRLRQAKKLAEELLDECLVIQDESFSQMPEGQGKLAKLEFREILNKAFALGHDLEEKLVLPQRV